MKTSSFTWDKMGINKKIGFSFSLLFILSLLVVVTAYISFVSIHRAENAIRISTSVGHQVLKMNYGTEKARLLLNHFYIHYQHLGLQTAHEKYAQPSIRQIAQVINTVETLAMNIASPLFSTTSDISPVDITLYLSSAKRFANLSIEFVQLITKRAAPKRGLEDQIEAIIVDISNKLVNLHPQIHLQMEMVSDYKEYIIHRQRHFMQSTLNTVHELEAGINSVTTLSLAEKEQTKSILLQYKDLAKQLLRLDLEIKQIQNDFILQEQTINPISETLIQISNMEVAQAQEKIEHVYRYSRIVILTLALISTFAMLSIFVLLHNSITKKVISLTRTAKEVRKGNLDARATVTGNDELGQLSTILNGTVEKLDNSLKTLEQKVEERTADLAESESRFRNLVSKLPTIAVQGYDNKRRVTYWNQASEKLYGYTPQEAMGKKIEDLIIPAPMKEQVITAICDWHDNDVDIPASEVTLLGKNGNAIQVYSTHVMLTSYRGEKCMYCIDQDLSDLKLAQAMEKRIESFYRQLFDHSSSGVAVYDAIDNGEDFVFKDFNRAGEEIEAIKKEEVLGRRITDVFPGVKKFGLLDTFRQVWQTGIPEHHPVTHYKDDRLQGWRENRIYRLPSGEIVAVYNDITKEKRLEEEKKIVETQLHRAQKMEAIGLMAGGVAHDLNNILSGITGYPELLLMQLPEDSALRKPLETIKQSGERAAAVVADLLTVARGVASSRINSDINTLILEYLDSPEYHQLQRRFPHVKSNHILEKNIPAISCSPIHVKKCLMNLVTNGAEAIENTGMITITTTTVTPDSQLIQKGLTHNTYVLLTVTDTGAGIAAEDIEHIFEPFYTRKVMGLSGTGLGLAVVWNTVEDHGGKIFIESSERGTSFQIYFPANRKTAAIPEKEELNTKKTHSNNNEHILVVDDEQILREIATSMLKNLGYQVNSVSSGEEAIAFVTRTPVDLLLIDMLMDPGINGLQTYEKILTLYPQQKAVVASGFSKNHDVTKTLEIGAGGFIKKPYSMTELGQAVQKALQG